MTNAITIAPVRDHDDDDLDETIELTQLDQVAEPVPATRAAARATNARRPQLSFAFDGTAAEWVGVWVGAVLITALTLGICYPWALVKTADWRTSHTLIDHQRLRFTGSARDLFGQWIVWLALSVVTVGVYSFWVRPRLERWVVEHQELDNSR